MSQGRLRGEIGGGIAALGAALVLTLALAGPAAAQEAPICLKAAEKLSDTKDNWHGTNGKDSVTGLRGNDKLDGRGGNDFINGSRDSDVVKGGPGNDLLCGGRGHDVIIGGPGNDKIYGEEENDTLIPGPGNDYVLGSAGDDEIRGWGMSGGTAVDDGIDILDGGFNDDQIEAGGADTLLGYTHDDVLSTKTPDIAPALMDGGGNNDVLYGSEAADKMRGGEKLSGDDKLFGNGGNDEMRGDGNDDQLFGQGGDDNLMGDDGFDALDGGDGDDTCDGGPLEDTASNCEHEIAIEHGARRLFGSVPHLLP
jgi:Ca2+-binding RTX toxin-like protein